MTREEFDILMKEINAERKQLSKEMKRIKRREDGIKYKFFNQELKFKIKDTVLVYAYEVMALGWISSMIQTRTGKEVRYQICKIDQNLQQSSDIIRALAKDKNMVKINLDLSTELPKYLENGEKI